MEKLLKILSTLIPLISCYPKWVQIFFFLLFVQFLVAAAFFVFYYADAAKISNSRKGNNFSIKNPVNGEFVSAPKIIIQGTGVDNNHHNSMIVKTINVDTGKEEVQSGKFNIMSDGNWSFEYCEFKHQGLYEIIIDAVFGGKKYNSLSKVNCIANKNFTNQLSIHITQHYRTTFEFSLIGSPDGHYIIKRLYLLYVNEYEWAKKRIYPEALMIKTFYNICLSRKYSEYDLLPLTIDNAAHAFEYKGSESDHFAINLFGTAVSKIRICAQVYDVNNSRSFILQSNDIEVVAGGNMQPLWDRSIPIENNKLIDELSPSTYKMITALDYKNFIPKFDQLTLVSSKQELRNTIKKLPKSSLKKYCKYIADYIEKTEQKSLC